MPIFDYACDACGFEWPDHYVHKDRVHVRCPYCEADMQKIWKAGSFPNVQDDTYIGGLTVENLGPAPITFSSRSEHRAYLKAHGYSQKVRHVGTPGEGSDKSAHTSKWV